MPIMDLTDPNLLSTITKLNAFGLALVSGAALGMYTFAIPIIVHAQFHPHSIIVMLDQFQLLITLGTKIMQTTSRTQVGLLLANAWMLYRHPDAEISRRGLWVLGAAVVYVQAAWYEVVFIFPTNDYLIDLQRKLQRERGAEKWKDDAKTKEVVLRKLESWKRWHVGRIVLPAVACLIVMLKGTA